MGVIRNVNPGNEPTTKGYLHGQLWNRPVASPGKWIIFRVVHWDVENPVIWLDGQVSNPPPPAFDNGQPNDPINRRPFNFKTCEVYTGGEIGLQFQQNPNNYPFRKLPASAQGIIGLQNVVWKETPPVFKPRLPGAPIGELTGASVSTIGINTQNINSRYLYFDFLGEFFHTLSEPYISRFPYVGSVMVYSAPEFPADTSVDWGNPVYPIEFGEIEPIGLISVAGTSTWRITGDTPPMVSRQGFTATGVTFAVDTISLIQSRAILSILDADTTLIPDRDNPFVDWNGSGSAVPVALKWDDNLSLFTTYD
jgi:hypothetical protein